MLKMLIVDSYFESRGGSLEQVLNEVRELTDIEFLYSFDLVSVDGLRPVNGQYTVDEALEIALQGTGLSGGLTESGMIVIARENSANAHNREEEMASGKVKKGLLASVSALFFGAGGQAVAQDGEVSLNENERDTIVVTARFREEGVQDIGASVVGISGDELAKKGLSDFEDIARSVAGVQNLKLQPNSNDISIRGLSNAFNQNIGGAFSSSSLVSVFFDDVPVSSRTPAQRDFNSFDLNRIEVIRGPQPTLFGEGSVGGTIRYFSQDPDLDGPLISGVAHTQFESIADGGVAYRGENSTTINLIPEKLGIRLTGFFRDDEGWVDNPTAGVEDANDFRSLGGRAVLLAHPTENFEIRLSAYISKDDIGQSSDVDVGSDPKDLVFSQTSIIGETTDDFEVYSGRVTYDAGGFELTSITGYYERELMNAAFNPGNTAGLAPFFPTINTTTFSNSIAPQKSFSQEFRFVSDLDGPINFTSGFIYRDREYSQTSNLAGDEFALVTTPSQTEIVNTVLASDSKAYSGFVELTYDVTDQLRLIGGARYVKEDLTTALLVDDVINFNFANSPWSETNPIDFVSSITTLVNAGFDTSFDFELEKVLPKFGIEYDVSDDILLYANFAEGVRNGGLNQPIAAFTVFNASGGTDLDVFFDALQFDEDTILSADWGAKTVWLDGDLIANVGMFYSKYKDTQIFANVPAASAVNGPDQTLIGLETELLWRLNENVSTFLNMSLLDAEFDGNFSSIDLSMIGVEFDVLEGSEPVNTPSLSFSAGYDLSYPINGTDFELFGSGVFQYIGKRFSSNSNFPSSELETLEIVNFRLGVENERFALSAFVTNALNEIENIYIKNSLLTSFLDGQGRLDSNPTQAIVNRPRTFGVGLTVRY